MLQIDLDILLRPPLKNQSRGEKEKWVIGCNHGTGGVPPHLLSSLFTKQNQGENDKLPGVLEPYFKALIKPWPGMFRMAIHFLIRIWKEII